MLISKKWLSQYMEISDLSIEEIAERITNAGLEVEGIEKGAQATNLVIGHVESCVNHPDSDHLHVCQVNVGSDTRQIVCGAPNVAAGQKVIVALDMGESNYLILLGADAYDVPHRGKDGEVDRDACEEVFRYFVCCVCPVKDGTPELGYFHGENEFHISMEKQIVGQPELGFLFPAFDDRTANLYNALFYSRKPDELHQEFIDAVFRTEPPMSAAEQRETFQSALCDALEESCSMEVVQSVHDYLRQRIQEHKDSRDPEPLAVTAGEVSGVLRNCGVPEERVEAFQTACGQSFGEGALTPANLIDAKHFAVKTADATIQVDPERSYLVEARVIDGRRYLLVPADESVEVNGLGVRIAAAKDGGETT